MSCKSSVQNSLTKQYVICRQRYRHEVFLIVYTLPHMTVINVWRSRRDVFIILGKIKTYVYVSYIILYR